MNDLPVGRSVDETIRLVQAFQYTDKHGEVRTIFFKVSKRRLIKKPMLVFLLFQVCPAGWKPGSDTIIPDPKEKMKYFKDHGGDL